MMIFNGQKAVSSVLSVLLLVIITFGVGIFLFNFVMGTMENVTEGSSTQPFNLFIENIAINDTCITVSVRNSWNRDATIDNVYVNNKPREVIYSNNKETIPENSAAEIYIPGSYSKGTRYEIKLICTSGHTLLSMQRY